MPTPEQLESIRQAVKESEDKLDELLKELRLAERAGIDVSERYQHYKELKEKTTRVKQVYGL